MIISGKISKTFVNKTAIYSKPDGNQSKLTVCNACSRRGGGGTPATPAARAASRSEVWPWSLLAAVALALSVVW